MLALVATRPAYELTTLGEHLKRVTLPLPTEAKHVHCYLLRSGDSGPWTLVDTGLGVADIEETWAAVLSELDAPVQRVVLTHGHADHAGGGESVERLTGATFHQGELDYLQCVETWGPDRLANVARWCTSHGLPAEVAAEITEDSRRFGAFVHFKRDPRPLAPGEDVDGWEVVALPGHADGQLGLIRGDVMLGADHLFARGGPGIGLFPERGFDPGSNPLRDYLASLARIVELDPRIVHPGHGEPVLEPARRAGETAEYQLARYRKTAATVGDEPLSAYQLSLASHPGDLNAHQRYFAVASTLSSLQYLVSRQQALRSEEGGVVTYRRAPAPPPASAA
jgi:glyoxylase-like metal-dependent hydrolase (beta-lactamase superfamily II)